MRGLEGSRSCGISGMREFWNEGDLIKPAKGVELEFGILAKGKVEK